MKPPRLPLHVHVNRYESTIWHVLIAVACYWLMGAIMMGCGGAPQSISLDPMFTPDQVAAIGDARDQWCGKTGWCPSWSADGEAHIVLTTGEHFATLGRSAGAFAYTDSNSNVVVVNGAKAAAEPDMFWVALAHELGHLQGFDDDRVDSRCTMYWKHTIPEYELVVR